MKTMILEGTFEEVQGRLRELPLPKAHRVRLVLSDEDFQARETPPLLPTPSLRNGVMLIPVKDPDRIVTSEFVKELAEEY
jgi:hypothetical protein